MIIRLDEYIEKRLLMARSTSFVDGNGDAQLITTEDGLARCSMSHTLPSSSMCFQNFIQRHSSISDQIRYSLVEFYSNSLAAGEPMTANTILCRKDLDVPYPFLKRIHWDHEAWFVFNESTGLLTDKWWHLFGCFPD